MTPEAIQDATPGQTATDRTGIPRPVSVEEPEPSGTEPPSHAPAGGNADPGGREVGPTGTSEELAEHAARKMCGGFLVHDERDREGAVEASFAVDRLQFAHLDDADALEAATFVDAHGAKDEVERAHLRVEESADDPEAFDDVGLAAVVTPYFAEILAAHGGDR